MAAVHVTVVSNTKESCYTHCRDEPLCIGPDSVHSTFDRQKTLSRISTKIYVWTKFLNFEYQVLVGLGHANNLDIKQATSTC